MVDHINNGESGLSVREKLNEVIDRTNILNGKENQIDANTNLSQQNAARITQEVIDRTEADNNETQARIAGDNKSASDRAAGDKALQDQIDELVLDSNSDVNSVNGKTGDVELDYSDVGASPSDHAHDNLYATKDDLASESDARSSADTDLHERIDAISEKGYDDTELVDGLAAEVQARADGDAALQEQIDSLGGGAPSLLYGSWIYNSSSATSGSFTTRNDNWYTATTLTLHKNDTSGYEHSFELMTEGDVIVVQAPSGGAEYKVVSKTMYTDFCDFVVDAISAFGTFPSNGYSVDFNFVPQASSGSSLWEQNGNAIYYNAGKVGIGTDDPESLLHLDGPSPRINLTDNDTDANHRINADSSVGNLSIDVDITDNQENPRFIVNMKGQPSLTVDKDAKVGIGMIPTRTTFDLSAKEQLAEWKTKAKKASWPIVTDGAFEQEPTEDLVEQWIETRAASDKLQVAGSISATGVIRQTVSGYGQIMLDGTNTSSEMQIISANHTALRFRNENGDILFQQGTDSNNKPFVIKASGDAEFSGKVFTNQILSSSGNEGLFFANGVVYPSKSGVNGVDNEIDLGDPNFRWKNGYFSGTVNAGRLDISNASGAGNFKAGIQVTATDPAYDDKAGLIRVVAAAGGNASLIVGVGQEGHENFNHRADGYHSFSRPGATQSSLILDTAGNATFAGAVHIGHSNNSPIASGLTVRNSLSNVTVDPIIGTEDYAAVVYHNWNAADKNGLLVTNNWASLASKVLSVGGTNAGNGNYTPYYEIDGIGNSTWGSAIGTTMTLASTGNASFTGSVDAAGFTINGVPISGGLPSGDFEHNGTITATDFIAKSDERLKTRIAPMPVGLIDDIKPVSWDWIDGGGKSAGVVAQQLQEIGLGDYVHENEDGQLGVNYQALTAILLSEVIALKKAIK